MQEKFIKRSALLLCLGTSLSVSAQTSETKIIALQQAQIAKLEALMRTPRILGSTKLPVVSSIGSSGSWTKAQVGEGQTFRNEYSRFLYPGQSLKARICVTWSDNCSNPNGSHFMLKYAVANNEGGNVAPTSKDVLIADGFEQTWSGQSLFHTGCSSPQPAAPIFNLCGGSWGGTCQLLIKRPVGDSCPVTFIGASMEWIAE